MVRSDVLAIEWEATMTLAEKQRLRGMHTCIMDMSSMRCRACNRGVPYPALTIAEIEESLRVGRSERKAAEKTIKRSPRR